MRKKETVQSDGIDFDRPITQKQFAVLVGVPLKDVGKLKRCDVLSPGGTTKEWGQQYDRFLAGVIFARKGWAGLAEARGKKIKRPKRPARRR